MTKESATSRSISSFVLGSFFRHSCFVIRHFGPKILQLTYPRAVLWCQRMSARKVESADILQPIILQSEALRLDLPTTALVFRRNGMEFRINDPIPVWTEMTVSLQTPGEARRFNCTGVVVACHGSRHAGYLVSM